MKQKKLFLTLAASAMIAAGFTSCSVDDHPIYEGSVPPPVVDNFDEGSVIQNGSCEGSLVDNFWVNIGQDGAEYAGPATIKLENGDNHCIIVDVRSEEEARAAGNFGAQTWADPNAYADHDTQFFITFGPDQALNNKDQIRITMDIKADEPFTAATGAHAAPGAYLSGFNNVNVNFTTEWASFDTGLVTVNGNPKAGTYSIAFNLAKGFANKVYFDNIRVEIIRFVPDPEPEKIDGYKVIFWNWGVAKEDQFSVKYFKNYVAPTAEDGAIVVESLEPSKNYNDQYWMANDQGQQIDAILTNNWDTQFLINLPEPLAKGTKGKLVMKVKADKATNAETQCHKAIPAPGAIEGKDGYGGTYMHYAFAGNINFTTEWNTVSVDFTVPDQADGMQAICLNLEVLKETNKYYFDDVTVYVEKTEEPTWVIDYANPKDAEGNSVTGYPYYRMSEPDGSSFNVENGLLVINNTKEQANNWDLQPFIIDWLTIKEGSGYKVRITMASSVAGKANLSFGTWSGANDQEFEFTASEDFKQYDIEFPSSTVSGENNVHILFQMGKVVGTVKIKKVEVFEL
jgi:hypothetical protein